MRGIKIAVALASGALLTGTALADGPGTAPRLNLTPTPATTPGSGQPAGQATTGQTGAAQATTPAPAQTQATPAPRAGAALPGGLRADVPSSFVFYTAPEAQAYMARIKATPPQGQTLGMLAPAGRAPTDEAFWGAIVTYEPIGRVPEEGALRLSAPELVDEAREARGPGAPRLEAFVASPAYAPASDSLTWGERRAAQPGQTRTIVYSQRLLGRDGVLKLDTNLTQAQLAEAQAVAPAMLAVFSYNVGSRHADFKPGDRESAFDLPGLVTGKAKPVALAQPATQQAAVAPEGGLPTWAPWAAIGAAIIGAVAWLAFLMRRKAPSDPNLTPS